MTAVSSKTASGTTCEQQEIDAIDQKNMHSIKSEQVLPIIKAKRRVSRKLKVDMVAAGLGGFGSESAYYPRSTAITLSAHL